MIVSFGVASLALSLVPTKDRTVLFYALICACGVIFLAAILLTLRAWRHRTKSTDIRTRTGVAPSGERMAIAQGAAIVYALLAVSTIVAGITLRSLILAVIPSLVCIPILGAITYWASRAGRHS